MEATSEHGKPTTKHKAASYCYLLINRSRETADSQVYRGNDAETNFVESLSACWDNIYRTLPYYT